MIVKISDYIADFLVKNNIKDVFMITGGGAMHLNDSLGHKEGLTCTFHHHEQACAIAAEAYASIRQSAGLMCDKRSRRYKCLDWCSWCVA